MNASKTTHTRSPASPEKFKVLTSGFVLVVMVILVFVNWNSSAFATSEVMGRTFLITWAALVLWVITTEFVNIQAAHLVSVGLGGVLVGLAVAATNWSQFSFIQWTIGWLTIAALVLILGRFRIRPQTETMKPA